MYPFRFHEYPVVGLLGRDILRVSSTFTAMVLLFWLSFRTFGEDIGKLKKKKDVREKVGRYYEYV